MVTNVSATSSILTATQPQARALGSGADAERPTHAPATSVDIDASRLEHREDVRLVRDDVADARDGVDYAIAIVRAARSALSEARDAAHRAADPATPASAREVLDVAFRSALQKLGAGVDKAVADGAALVSGDALAVDADPDSEATHQIVGLDIRLKAAVTGEEALLLTRGASVADADSAEQSFRAADRSLGRFDAGLRRLEGESARLNQHGRLLGALDAALGQSVAPDLDAEAARLMALQIRQELAGGGTPIANARPNALLALFRD